MVAPLNRIENDPFAQAGERLFEQILPKIKDAHPDSYVVMDVASGDFEVDADHLTAVDRLQKRRPGARMWVRQVGHRFLRVFGSHRRLEST